MRVRVREGEREREGSTREFWVAGRRGVWEVVAGDRI
jgi:hypothetical protein